MSAPIYWAWNQGDFLPGATNDHWVVLKRTQPRQPTSESEIVWDAGVTQRGDAETRSLAYSQAGERNRQSYAEHVAGKAFTRYLTHRHCTIAREHLEELAKRDGTSLDDIKITPDVQVLYNNSAWMLWSDDKITTAHGANLPPGGSLPPAAVELIGVVRESDSGIVNLPGGVVALTRVQEVLSEDTVYSGASRGHYSRERIEHMRVRWTDGTEGDLYAVTAGYFEGFQYDIYGSLKEAQAAFGYAPGPEGITVFPPDDYDLDPRLGYVRKDE